MNAASPFTPGVPATPDIFRGRAAEVNRLREKALVCSHNAQPQFAYISGARGIGKSSMAAYLRLIVENQIGLVGTYAFLGGVGDLNEMARRLLEKLLSESRENDW